MMTHKQRALAVLNYEPYDRLPLVHFGFWEETLQKWHREGHLTLDEVNGWENGDAYLPSDRAISAKLGFDHNWYSLYRADHIRVLYPLFEEKVLDEAADGTRKLLNCEGVIVLQKEGAQGIPAEVDHLLKDRASWEQHYVPRLQLTPDRINFKALEAIRTAPSRPFPYGYMCGSLFGVIRNWWGVVGLSYLCADDPALYDEVIETVGNLCYRLCEKVLAAGVTFDFGHFWEDICFKGGPLVNPAVFKRKVGPHYARITELLRANGIRIVSVDCDGKIDKLIPIWLENGVNTMFPIEVGTWGGNIAPWRKLYGKELRGIGGMDKRVFARDRAAIDAEIERLKPLVDLGGYIPCPDHLLAPDAEWDNVRYYCDRFRTVFS